MKYFIILTVALSLSLSAQSANKDEVAKKKRAAKQLQIEMEKEKKYSREQQFYQSHNYDFKGAEVNKDSLDSVPNIETQDDFDMDSVYD